MTKRSRIVLIHITCWVVYFIYELTIIRLIGGVEESFAESLTFTFNIALFYLYVSLLFPVYLERKRYIAFFGYALLLTGLLVYLRYQTIVTIIPLLTAQPLTYPYDSLRMFLAGITLAGRVFLDHCLRLLVCDQIR